MPSVSDAGSSVSDISDICQFDGNASLFSQQSDAQCIPVRITVRGENRVSNQEKRIPVRKVLKRNNVLLQALNLPSVMNINPRSIYNKVDEFLTLVEQYESDLIFMSETWDRINKPLENLI